MEFLENAAKRLLCVKRDCWMLSLYFARIAVEVQSPSTCKAGLLQEGEPGGCRQEWDLYQGKGVLTVAVRQTQLVNRIHRVTMTLFTHPKHFFSRK